MGDSIFSKLYKEEEFVDRYNTDNFSAVDVIIPVIHTNELWEKNLISIYREIPVNRLLIGDGGCLDDTIDRAKKFPRVTVVNQKSIKTLGYAILDLIKRVETPFFIYLHSDVYIPSGWFDEFSKNTDKFDWFECQQRIVSFIEYDNIMDPRSEHNWGFGGSHMGRRSAFDDVFEEMDDDYVYRNEDIIIRKLLQRHGHKWGFDAKLFHYHEVMHKDSPTGRRISGVRFNVDIPDDELFSTYDKQFKGLVKYVNPDDDYLKYVVRLQAVWLLRKGYYSYRELRDWTKKTNIKWLEVFNGRLKIDYFKDLIKSLTIEKLINRLFYFGYNSKRELIIRLLGINFIIKRAAKSSPFIFRDKKLDLYESEYNCGFKNRRMTERSIELAILNDWIVNKKNVIEVGAVSPYYFPGLIKDICDPADPHKLVNYKCSLFDIDFTDRDVVSVSTLEHVGTFEHNLTLIENPAEALAKLIKESRTLLVTFPYGYNPILDEYVLNKDYEDIRLGENYRLEVIVYRRGITDNVFKIIDRSQYKKLKYSRKFGTTGLVVVIKDII